MKRKTFDHLECPIAQSLEVVGERWTPLILRNILIVGHTRFDELQGSLDIATQAAMEFRPVLKALAKWGTRWTKPKGITGVNA